MEASINSIWGFIAGWLLAGQCSGIQPNMVRWRQGISFLDALAFDDFSEDWEKVSMHFVIEKPLEVSPSSKPLMTLGSKS